MAAKLTAGALDRRITIQRAVVSQSASGAPTRTWTALSHRRAASVVPARGSELDRTTSTDAVTPLAVEIVRITVRWSSAIADLSPKDRVLYPPPADADEQSPASRTVYDIRAVHEIDRRRMLRILAERKPDVSP